NFSANSSDWKHVKFNQDFNQPNPALQATYLGNNKWQFTITGGLRAYYGLTDPNEVIQKIAILFRNGNGALKQANTDGSDMYIPVNTSALAVRFTLPLIQPTYIPTPVTITKNIGDNIAMTAVANIPSALKLYFNGTVVQTATNATTISANPVIAVGGTQVLVTEATNGGVTVADTIKFFVSGGVTIAPLPAGVRDGINYNSNNTSATLVLYAPGKMRVSVIGEFAGSNWTEKSQYQLNNTADGNYWWITLNGLTPGTEYAFQYLVDGTLKIAEPYTEKVLDPYNDQYIPASTYPALKPYPTGLTTGVVSILQTAAPTYNWQVNNFQRPDKRSLVIYELLVRDFVAKHDWNTLRDTLNYLKKLGINAIEIMPFNEFEGNISWGYNPDFYFAPDKYYGPENTLKEFIDSAHRNGIAVVMDIALNHSFGLAPMVQLYWDAANNRPAANNPWFNPVPKHAFNVGYDMNHESPATHYFVSRVVEHWLTDYKIDGFRFDLSKGFTQTQTCDANGNNCNVAAWGDYDQSRVNIWEGYYDTLQLKSSGSYCILEHFADNTEETVLSNYGMMLWGNMNYNYNQATMGYNTGWNFDYGIASVRGWTNPYLVTYAESHDEERLMYKNIQFGNSSGSYNIKDTITALRREEMAAAFLFTIPGPKMLWQFGELGYDYSITSCHPGNIIPQPYPQNNCRTDPKPIRWDYLQQPARKKLYDVYSALIKLRFNNLYKNIFISNTTQQDFTGAFKYLKLSQGGASIVVIGNFDVVSQTGSVTFQNAGTWYDYLNGTTITATGAAQSFTLQPGEYHVYLNMNAALPVTLISFDGKHIGNKNLLSWKVANETGLDHYELQRSDDGQNFSGIATINATGNANYSFADVLNAGSSPIYFYRLKSVDKDGNFKLSAIIKIRTTSDNNFVEVNPNPFKDKLKVSIETASQDKVTLIITDMSGRQLVKEVKNLFAGNNIVEINEAGKFADGSYLLTVASSQQMQTIKIVKGN
ncbi:MAG: alpha-amylase family glycosyl hydrolase, partial [Bacteroidota bacterium]|nr:alpha-amylase family glycosyl hydrolase [Bacteroidota bacterium]